MKTYTNSADGSDLVQGAPFVINGIAFPANWLDLASADDLAEHGITLQDVPDPPPAPPIVVEPFVVTIVTPRQARLALLAAGLLDQVEAAVSSAGGATKITWDYATQISRTDPLITTLGSSLNLTSDQIDNLFLQASTL